MFRDRADFPKPFFVFKSSYNSLLATSIHALGLLPQDQAFIHIQNVQNSTVAQRMDDGTTMGAKEVMVVDAPTLSFLFSLSSAVDAVVHLHSKRLLEENLNQSELLHQIRSESVCENMVVILSRAGRVNLAVSLARHATHLVKVADSGNVDRFLKGRGIALPRLGSLSLYEVAVLSSVRTLNFLSLQVVFRFFKFSVKILLILIFSRHVCMYVCMYGF